MDDSHVGVVGVRELYNVCLWGFSLSLLCSAERSQFSPPGARSGALPERIVLHFAESFDRAQVGPLDAGGVAVKVAQVVIAVGEEDCKASSSSPRGAGFRSLRCFKSLDAEAER